MIKNYQKDEQHPASPTHAKKEKKIPHQVGKSILSNSQTQWLKSIA